MAWTDAQDAEDMEGMLSVPPKRTAKRWPWLVGATAVLCVMGIGVRQLGSVNDETSIVDHVSMVHGKISTILAAATEKKSYSDSLELLVTSFEDKDKTFKEAMSFHAKLKVGGAGKWPKITSTSLAKPGKGAALQKKYDTLFQDGLEGMPPKKADEIKKATKIEQDGDKVTVVVTLPKKEFKKEDEELKAALKEHKPKFTADIAFARDFADMMDHKSENVGMAIRGFEAKVGSVLAGSLIDAISQMPGLPPAAQAMVGLVRSAKVRNEIYYDDDHLAHGLPLPPLVHVLPAICGKMSPKSAKDVKGLNDVFAEYTQFTIEGLPYQWELVVEMKGVNAGPLEEFCAK